MTSQTQPQQASAVPMIPEMHSARAAPQVIPDAMHAAMVPINLNIDMKKKHLWVKVTNLPKFQHM